jgi:hypothetical protein
MNEEFEVGQFYGEFHDQDDWHLYSGIYSVHLCTELNAEGRYRFVHVARYLKPNNQWDETYMGQVITLSPSVVNTYMRKVTFDFNQISIGI